MIIMKRSILAILLLTLGGTVTAQQLPQFTQFHRNQYITNPAAAGLYDFIDITASSRWQWAGFENAPMTLYLAGSSPIGRKGTRPMYNPSLRVSSRGPIRNPQIKTGSIKHAVGGTVMVDQYGAFRRMHFNGTYALHLPVARDYNLSMGVNVGMANNAFLRDKIELLQQNDATFDSYVADGTNKFFLDIGAGLLFYSDQLFVGISADQLTKDFVSFGNASTYFQQLIHFKFNAGYKIPVSEEWTIQPSALVKFMRPAPVSWEGNVQVEYNEWIWAALGYRHQDALIGMLGLNINETFKFGYSFDFALSTMRSYSTGGHELVLGVMLGRK